jgi:hypothetical protein
MCSLSECLEVSFKQRLFIGPTVGLVMDGPASIASKPAPTVDLCRSQIMGPQKIQCGSGLAREEARKNTLQLSVKPPDK